MNNTEKLLSSYRYTIENINEVIKDLIDSAERFYGFGCVTTGKD